ncbi:carbohydrate ABC transporter permease [Actinocatenispora rupis]|uniref:Glycerol-3-phosphate ABC transporter permease n=1 Tax=Actinocatenispora rupis TaxID=519421 RepID=A0A8J3JAY3_9ACTN|nr:sugar ABC transporter permease [Actinocatenispora rupis]GID15100.1 glycerol-3-phosphate ABC transporter permease [Actinocatenispora rupis]
MTVTDRSSAAPADAADPPTRGTPASPRRRRRREYLLFLAFIAPNAVLLAVFAYWPIVFNGYLSLTSWDMLSPTIPFVGLANYADMFGDPDFWAVLGRTVLFSGAVVIGCLIAGLAVAMLLNQKLVGRNLVRTVSFAPHILSGVAMGTVWLFIFDPQIGLMKVVLEKVGIAGPAWMTDSSWAMWGLVLVYLWKNIGFVAVVYMAGLQGMPTDLYEAARLDGAGPWTLFRRITLPLLSPVTFFVTVVTIVGTFQAFDVIAIMTNGGPGDATTTISWYIYKQAFQALDAGHAGAGALVMFVILIAITAAQARFMERRVHYR